LKKYNTYTIVHCDAQVYMILLRRLSVILLCAYIYIYIYRYYTRSWRRNNIKCEPADLSSPLHIITCIYCIHIYIYARVRVSRRLYILIPSTTAHASTAPVHRTQPPVYYIIISCGLCARSVRRCIYIYIYICIYIVYWRCFLFNKLCQVPAAYVYVLFW